MEYNIYYILAALAVIYLAISVFNKKHGKRRKNRKFMEGYERKEKTQNKEGKS